MKRQDVADKLDDKVMERLLPAAAIESLGNWLSGDGARYAMGTGSHAAEYVPERWSRKRWSAISPWWPDQLGERSCTEMMWVSRAEVVQAVRDAVAGGAWAEALVASYVWGQGTANYGPYRLNGILKGAEPGRESRLADVLSRAATTLQEQGAVAAYSTLNGAVTGLGPAFVTKFLYFLELALSASPSPRVLILDSRVARTLRAYATRVGLGLGLKSAASVAKWIWSDGGWTPHRYGVYLRWMTAASQQLVSSDVPWPVSSPDLLELALFSEDTGIRDGMTAFSGPACVGHKGTG